MESVKVLAIDPGTHGLGWCILKHRDSRHPRPMHWGLLKSNDKKGWQQNCINMWSHLDSLYYEHMPKRVIMEYPEFWAGEVGSAARESGSLFKLVFLCGGIYKMFSELMKITMVTPSGWKGQLSKDLVRERLSNRFDYIDFPKLDHNTVDAIGIGYYTLLEENKK